MDCSECRGDTNSFGVPCETRDKNHVDVTFLDAYATKQWETILHFLVGTEISEEPGGGVLQLLNQAKLMEGDPLYFPSSYLFIHKRLLFFSKPRSMRITYAGFAFLLQDINAQLWTLLLQYLEHSTTLSMDPVDVLHFLFMLGSLELGQHYSTSMLTDTQHHMLQDLRDYGIVFQRKVAPPSSLRFLMFRANLGDSIPLGWPRPSHLVPRRSYQISILRYRIILAIPRPKDT